MKACPQCNTRYPADAVYCFVDGRELSGIRDALLGTTVGGRYLVEDIIGEGGMAMVYRARHKLVDRVCAIKVMNQTFAGDPTGRERFRREAKSAQMLGHPNIIEIFDQGETSGRDALFGHGAPGGRDAEPPPRQGSGAPAAWPLHHDSAGPWHRPRPRPRRRPPRPEAREHLHLPAPGRNRSWSKSSTSASRARAAIHA